ncbi:MAG: GntR family transcriptional regulator [Alphaproteobacteria bacterium]|nr:GntR family transcriptional regulator [Alphaproteobacteria bacterium]
MQELPLKAKRERARRGGPRVKRWPPAARPAAADPRGALGDLVYRGLRRAIIEQALVPGTKLPEDMVGRRFGVSRTVIRSVLVRLAGEGLVELRFNRSAVVAQPSLSEANDLFEVRQGLERVVVARLAGRLTRDDVRRLRQHVDAEVRAGGGTESIRLAGEFHVLLADLTRNATMARFVSEVASRSSLILSVHGRPHSSECAVTEHREIIDALARGDGNAAQAIMDRHLAGVVARALLAPRPSRDIGEILSAYAGL